MTWEDVAAAVAENPADHQKRESLKKAIDEIERTMPRPPAHAMALVDQKPTAPDTFVLRRGDYRNKGPKVSPRPPGIILASQSGKSFAAGIDHSSGRQDRAPIRPGSLACRDGQSTGGPGDRQPALAISLHPRDRGRRRATSAFAASSLRIPSFSTGWPAS